MGIFNRKSKREVGENFDKDEADKIFDALDKSEKTKKLSKSMQKEVDITKEVSELLDKAKSVNKKEAIDIYERVIALDVSNGEAYLALADIYNGLNETKEKEVLKRALKNIKTNDKTKNEVMKRLKELN